MTTALATIRARSDVAPPPLHVRVTVRPSVFSERLIIYEAPALATLSDIFARSGEVLPPHLSGIAWIDGYRVGHEHWHLVRPKAGTAILIAILPRDQRTALLIGGSLAFAAAGLFLGPLAVGALGLTAGTLGATAVTAGVGAAVAIGGTMLLNALLPPPDMGNQESESFEQASIGSVSNQVRPYDPIPVVMGKRKVVPPLAARPYSLVRGNQLHSYYLFAISCGRTDIAEMKFGDTDIAEFNDLLVETFEGTSDDPNDSITLFSKDRLDERVNVQLTQKDSPYTRTTPASTKKITIIFHAPAGPYFVNSKGETRYYEIDFDVRYRPVSGGGWTQWLSDEGLGNDRPSSKFWSFDVDVTPDEYEVEVTRRTGDNDDQTQRNDVIYWLSIVSTQALGGATLFPDRVALVAIRVRDQGSLGEFNCVAHSYADVHDGGGSWSAAKTSNPASLFRRVLQGYGLVNNVGDDKLDLDSLQDWWEYCDDKGLEFNGVFDQARPVSEALDTICVRGRASFDFVENRYGVIVDRPSTEPVRAVITARNLSGLSVDFDTQPVPQVLRMRFAYEGNNYEPDERLVYDDGYNVNSADFGTAEVIDLVNSCTSKNLAYREGRRWLAHRRLRRERVSGRIGLEHLMLRRGAKVAWQHWAGLIGIGPGLRIRTVTGNPATAITVDQPVTMKSGKTYGVRIRSLDGSTPTFDLHEVDLDVGTTTTLTFASSVDPPPAVGDLVAFGILQSETSEMIVLAREPLLDGAMIVMTQAAPGIDDAETGEIPPWDPNITLSAKRQVRPAVPEIIDIVVEPQAVSGHPDVLRAIVLVVTLARSSGKRPPPAFIEIRLRTLGGDDAWRIEQFSGSTQICKVGSVKHNRTYEVEARALGFATNGQTLASRWSDARMVVVPKVESTPGKLARVRNLELIGQATDTIFTGRDPTFSWTIASGLGGVSIDELTGGVDSFVDPSFGYFEVVISASGHKRRTERTHEPKYTYSWSRNLEDAEKRGEAYPASRFTIAVTLVDKFKKRSNTAKLTVTNPEPATPTVTVTAGLQTIFVSIEPPSDGDFAGIIVWASTTSGFTPGPGNEQARTKSNIRAEFSAPPVAHYVRVAAYDDFRSDPSLLNVSSEILVTPASASALDLYDFDGLVFTADPGFHVVSWTSGTAIITEADGTVSTYAISSSSAQWSTSRLYIYYIRGETRLRSTTSISTATGTDRTVIEAYGGGNNLYDLRSTRTKLLATDLLVANSIGAGLIVVDQAVITETAQIKNSIITSAKIRDAEITRAKIEDLAVNTIKLSDGSVITGKIGNEAATAMRDFFSNGNVTINDSNGNVEVASITIADAEDLPVAIFFACQVRTSDPNVDINLRVRRNSTTILDINDYYQNLNPLQTLDHTGFMALHLADRSPGNGERTYQVQLSTEQESTFVASRRSMLVIHHKR
jgi:hypothetical protein